MEKLVLNILLLIVFLSSCERQEVVIEKVDTPFLQVEEHELASLLKSMSLEEKVGQLIFLDLPDLQNGLRDSLLLWSQSNMLSGMMIEEVSFSSFYNLTKACKRNSKKPFLIGTKEASNMINTFSKNIQFPKPATLACLNNDSIQSYVGNLYQQQLEHLSIDFIFGPNVNDLVDDNFGYNYQLASQEKEHILKAQHKSLKHKNGLGIFCIADSFNDYLLIEDDSLGIKAKALQKYLNLSMNGLQGMHIKPELFLTDTLQENEMDYLKTYLYNEIHFDGLLFTSSKDASTLKDAFYGGADAIIISNKVKETFDTLVRLYRDEVLPIASLNDKVARIIKAKEWVLKNKKQNSIKHDKVKHLLNEKQYPSFVQGLYEQASIAKLNSNFIPITYLRNRSITVHVFSNNELKEFKEETKLYKDLNFKNYSLADNRPLDPVKFGSKRSEFHIIILDEVNLHPQLDAIFTMAINNQKDLSKIAIVNFGNPNNLNQFDNKISFLQHFESNKQTHTIAASQLFGAKISKGDFNPKKKEYHFKNRNANKQLRLSNAKPEQVGISSKFLMKIDTIMAEAIDKQAIPGAQILAIKNGKIFYNKAFGHHTYNKSQAVHQDDLYDLASISKIASTALAVMSLYDRGKIKLNDKLKNLNVLSADCKAGNVSISNLLLHQSNLQPNMPVYDYVTIPDSVETACQHIYCRNKRNKTDVEIAKGFFMNPVYRDSLWLEVEGIKPYKKSKYRYSDVNFNLLQKVIEEKSAKTLDKYVMDNFYSNLGLKRIMYNPLSKFAANKIVPTEHDFKWRKQLLRGFVHDEYAAIQGGVAGSAGLFSNAKDLGVLFQMLLNGGEYGGIRYLRKETIALFTSAPFGSKRGLAFDKPRGKYTESCSTKASTKTFGHSGFTGTCVWVDPENDLIFVFLSNRIHPSIENRKLFRDKYRGRIHTVFYEAMDTYKHTYPGIPIESSLSNISAIELKKNEATNLSFKMPEQN